MDASQPQNVKKSKNKGAKKARKQVEKETKMQNAVADPNSNLAQFQTKKERIGGISRAESFKAKHPGVDCPKAISKQEFKDMSKRHGAGKASG